MLSYATGKSKYTHNPEDVVGFHAGNCSLQCGSKENVSAQLYGTDSHVRYHKFPDGTSSYDLIMSRLPMMKSYQSWMGTKMSVTPESTLRLRDNLYDLWKNGINQFIIGYAHGMNWNDESLLNYERGMRDVCELYLEMKYNKQYFRITSFEEKTICDTKETSFGCGVGRGRKRLVRKST